MTPATSPPLQGTILVPGDKSISHRALILSALTAGESRVSGLADNADIRATRACLEALGATMREQAGDLLVQGGPLLQAPATLLDAQNSGTTMRLLAGVLAAQPFESVLTGDASLQKRPMARIIEPLARMGARITGEQDDRFAPLRIRPVPSGLHGTEYRMPHASAQVKSALLLAGLYAEGETRVIEPVASRDHTERMLAAAGVTLHREGEAIVLPGRQIENLRPQHWQVPGDPSSAAFWLVAAACIPGSRLRLLGINLNPHRIELIHVLQTAGADIAIENAETRSGEPVGDLRVTARPLRGHLSVEGAQIPRLIDELPILAVAATQLDGSLTVRGAAELRTKESDRIAGLVAEFAKLGMMVEEFADGFRLTGPVARPNPSAPLEAHHDHRIAMSLMVLNRIADPARRWEIRGREWAGVSYPAFETQLFTGVS